MRALLSASQVDKHFISVSRFEKKPAGTDAFLRSHTQTGTGSAGYSSALQLISACGQRQWYLSYKTDF